jgi:acetolactate synthase I/II/III large subunit
LRIGELDGGAMKVHGAVATALAQHGTDTIFGLMGDANMLYLTDFVRDQHGRFIASTHECAGVSMADGYSRVSGNVGVVSVTHGPALTNTLTALVEATRNRSRLLLITGETPWQDGHLQFINIGGVIAPTGAGYERVYKSADVEAAMGRAFRRIDAERRPIVLDVPFDLLLQAAPSASVYRIRSSQTPGLPALPDAMPDAATLDQALGLLASASRPVIVAGRGAVHAREALVRLARAVGASLSTSLLAKDLFRGVEGNLGICGTVSGKVAARELAGSDCVLVFGAGLNRYTAAALPEGAKIIQCDADVAAFGACTPIDVPMLGDARTVATAMERALSESGISRSQARLARLESEITSAGPGADFADASDDETVDLRSAMIRIDEVLPAERIVVTDVGRFMQAPWCYLHVDDPRHFVHSCNFGSIGLGLGTAIGAAIAAPDLPVVAVLGDGGFMMNMSELSTAIRQELRLLVVIANDGAYGAEYRKLAAYGVDPAYSLSSWPNFSAVAEAMGGRSLDVSSVKDIDRLADLMPALGNGPVLVNLMLNPAVEIGA